MNMPSLETGAFMETGGVYECPQSEDGGVHRWGAFVNVPILNFTTCYFSKVVCAKLTDFRLGAFMNTPSFF